MEEILYLEVPTPDTATVLTWLQQEFEPGTGKKLLTPDGFRLLWEPATSHNGPKPAANFSPSPDRPTSPASSCPELSVFIWTLQRTTYLKVFRLSDRPVPDERQLLARLTSQIQTQFPPQYPKPPVIDLSQQSIFEALAPHYPLTVKYFQTMPKGEYDLKRLYWWEMRWREGVRHPHLQQSKQVLFKQTEPQPTKDTLAHPAYDLIYIGGALGAIHAAVMARLGYRVLLLERLPFGRMNREWNISRSELQNLIDLGLFTPAEVESFIAKEYRDGYSKFFDAYSCVKAAVLHTPQVLNVALDAEKLLHLCGQKLEAAGGEIWDETEFVSATVNPQQVTVQAEHLPTSTKRIAVGRLMVDAMGTASPIARQLNGDRAFDSVCPTVGAVIDGLDPAVWDLEYGDVLNSHGDISRGRQLIWELFPATGTEVTIYLFHYHQIHPENPGSLLELYEDFFTILPEYRRCDLDKLTWKKPTFGYIPGSFSTGDRDRVVAFDRLIAIGDAASLQSPLVFTGFGSLVRNLSRLTDLLNTALKHDLLDANHLEQIRAYQSNVSVTWLFSKGMMVPTGRCLPPARINAILNTFFGLLAEEPPTVANTFIKDRTDWLMFNQLALKAAWKNPQLLLWILDLIDLGDLGRWLLSYLNFTFFALASWLFGWLPNFARRIQPWLEPRLPAFWLWLLAVCYALTDGVGQPQPFKPTIGLAEKS